MSSLSLLSPVSLFFCKWLSATTCLGVKNSHLVLYPFSVEDLLDFFLSFHFHFYCPYPSLNFYHSIISILSEITALASEIISSFLFPIFHISLYCICLLELFSSNSNFVSLVQELTASPHYTLSFLVESLCSETGFLICLSCQDYFIRGPRQQLI